MMNILESLSKMYKKTKNNCIKFQISFKVNNNVNSYIKKIKINLKRLCDVRIC